MLLRLPRGAAIRYHGAERRFAAGHYVYIGSAMGGLRARLARHRRTVTVRHWHIDGLLAVGKIVDVQIRLTSRRDEECRLAHEIAAWPGARPVPRFGSTDCRCPTHLYVFGKRPRTSIRLSAVLRVLRAIMARLRAAYGEALPVPRDPFQTLVACILSLRTRDPVTDAAARRLFARLSTPTDIASASEREIAERIYPVGMYRTKSRTLVAVARAILARHGGTTPSDIDDLCALPGVGRKTANLVRSFAFRLPAVCVDTHVHRIANRLGLVRAQSPDETETELRRVLPRRYWIELNPLLVRHGQAICQPRRAHCERCMLADLCGLAERSI
jgi:endonuclease III